MIFATQQPAWLADIHAYAGWVSDKGGQVEPSSLVAFGIPIDSRYGKVWEIVEMLAFAHLAARCGVAGYVDSVFYDSKSCCCTVQLKPEAERQPDVVRTLGECGDRTLSQFTMDEMGIVRGRGCPE